MIPVAHNAIRVLHDVIPVARYVIRVSHKGGNLLLSGTVLSSTGKGGDMQIL